MELKGALCLLVTTLSAVHGKWLHFEALGNAPAVEGL